MPTTSTRLDNSLKFKMRHINENKQKSGIRPSDPDFRFESEIVSPLGRMGLMVLRGTCGASNAEKCCKYIK